MSELIDKQGAIYAVGLNTWAGSRISSLPIVDAVPVRHGKWIKISPANIFECSKCGKNVMTNDISEYNFCHGCGAKMDGERREDDGV